MKYIVEVREVHIQPYEVEADSPEQAIQNVKDGEEDKIAMIESGFEYSHTLDSEFWTVEEK